MKRSRGTIVTSADAETVGEHAAGERAEAAADPPSATVPSIAVELRQVQRPDGVGRHGDEEILGDRARR